MARGGKLTKLKSVLKKLNSFNKQSSSVAASTADDHSPLVNGEHLHPVYVGKSRRRYLVGSDVLDHPLFKELSQWSSESKTLSVSCEVVLFEHLLWMLKNPNPHAESLEDLVDFYAC